MVRGLVRVCLIALLALFALPIFASSGSTFTVPRVSIGPALAEAEAAYGPLSGMEGEIAAVDGGRVFIRGDGGRWRNADGSASVVFINGEPSCIEAMRPVTGEALFWARLWLSEDGSARLIEAIYCGGELTGVRVHDGRLTGSSPASGETVTLVLAKGCSPAGISPGSALYVLLDFDGRVRWYKVLSQDGP